MSRDNTKKIRGFIYQRQYAIYLFLDDTNSLIIEGNINNKTYEDIAIKNNDNKLKTYQIKYYKNKEESLCRSSDFF